MREQTLAMYCFLDDLLPHMRPVTTLKPHVGRHLNDAQVLTTALVAARYFGGNLVLGQRYLEQHWGQAKLDKSGFCRRLHALADTLAALFATFWRALKQLYTQAR